MYLQDVVVDVIIYLQDIVVDVILYLQDIVVGPNYLPPRYSSGT